MSFNLLSIPVGSEPAETSSLSAGDGQGQQPPLADPSHSATVISSAGDEDPSAQASLADGVVQRARGQAQDVRGGMGGFAEYFEGKVRRLREQYLQEQAAAGCVSSIFTGVTVWVDGRTEPPKEEIELLLKANGGVFEHYFHADVVTHIVAETLAPAHINRQPPRALPPPRTPAARRVRCSWRRTHVTKPGARYRNMKLRRQPVVRPAWLLACLEQGRRVPHAPFVLPGTAHDDDQARPSSI